MTPSTAKPDLIRADNGRTLLCGECERPVLLCQDERTDKVGYVCRDQGYSNSRRLLTVR